MYVYMYVKLFSLCSLVAKTRDYKKTDLENFLQKPVYYPPMDKINIQNVIKKQTLFIYK